MKCQAKGKNQKRGKIRKRENLSWVNEGGWVAQWVGKKGAGAGACVGGGRSLRCEILLSRNTKYMQIAK